MLIQRAKSKETSFFSGDGLNEKYHNGNPFSTYDADNDSWGYKNCAYEYVGAWWYGSCGTSCLNGFYYTSSSSPDFDSGIKWSAWHEYYSFRASTMMIQKN